MTLTTLNVFTAPDALVLTWSSKWKVICDPSLISPSESTEVQPIGCQRVSADASWPTLSAYVETAATIASAAR